MMSGYTRSLEAKIAALESRVSSETRNSSVEGVTNSAHDDANEYARSEHEVTSYVDRREPEDRDTQSLVIPASETPAVSFSSSSYPAIANVSPIVEDQCGHSSLLIGILATLTSGNPCGIASRRSDAWHGINLSASIVEGALKPSSRTKLSSNAQDTLVQVYLERVNPRYPFLHVETFSGWYESWKSRSHSGLITDPKDRWADFIVTMVHAVSILLTPQVSQNDIVTSQALYNDAMKYAPFVFARPDPILHAQAYLLLTLHALHSPSSQMIIHMASITMRHCAIHNLHLAECERQERFPAFSRTLQIRRRVFWSARIQSRILNTMMRSDFHKINATSAWREHMLEELESWRTQIERLSHNTNRGYLSDRWVGMAYNYTVLILFQPNKINVLAGFGDRSVQACAQLALTFRAFQKDRQTAQLWPGLLSQFAVGVTLLYCFWATPPSYRTPAYRSPEAEPLRDVFDILAKEIPIYETSGIGHSPRCISTQSVSLIQSQMQFMRDVVRNRGVLRMVQEMISENFPVSPVGRIQTAPTADLESGGAHSSHLCSEHCALFDSTTFFDPTHIIEPDSMTDGGSNEPYGDFEDSVMFPAFFGSAEF
ncbi:uncharacterized protein N7477_003693 [Penicillium maclennaniae]|uniref:uncharacterized protein n=1 Tax=Penicillium maclennaniae TaxID=1343394 RepID=UPI00254230FA|nr:uncharacterized protein N7477_003693 [Penicillium maclennaniae]KAJ5678060.1 hypothetical protein N7477_003693 [Penicillium maclennaniae]